MKPKPSPRKGIELSWLAIIKAIGLPLALVAADIGTDGKLLFEMASFVEKFGSAEDQDPLFGLFLGSCFILIGSILNLTFGNPSKTLIRNVRTSVFMASREMESKDMSLPIGEYIVNQTNPQILWSILDAIPDVQHQNWCFF